MFLFSFRCLGAQGPAGAGPGMAGGALGMDTATGDGALSAKARTLEKSLPTEEAQDGKPTS